MRLLHASQKKLVEFSDNTTPAYAILSHTWGDEELTFLDIAHHDVDDYGYKKAAFKKVVGCCQQTLLHGLEYVWVDTCCIDKSSSAELSEAINSMFSWYQRAKVCFAYLSDVNPSSSTREVRDSRWFTRGWTLQELLAPETVLFYDTDWCLLGSKQDLHADIWSATGIHSDYLTGAEPLEKATIAQRMSWAANRQTSRKEDIAYCLLGIFGVNMPMLYGEGVKSFIRLQEEIIKVSRDLSIFAWGFKMPWSYHSGVFAPSPREFRHCSNIEHVGWPANCDLSEPYYFSTNKGLQIHLPIQIHWSSGTSFVILDCGIQGSTSSGLIALPLPFQKNDDAILVRHGYARPLLISKNIVKEAKAKDVCIRQPRPDYQIGPSVVLQFSLLVDEGYTLAHVFPPFALQEVSLTGRSISLLSSESTMVIFQKGDEACLYVHFEGGKTPVVRALLSPLVVDNAYLYWRLATSKSLLDAIEQDWLTFPSVLVFLEFDASTSSREPASPLRANPSAVIEDVWSSSRTQNHRRSVNMGPRMTPHCTIEFAHFEDFPDSETILTTRLTPAVILRVATTADKFSWDLVSRARELTTLQSLRLRLTAYLFGNL